MYHGQVVIEGNLTQDPELTVVPSGKSVCRFSIATNRFYRNADQTLVNEVTYIDIDSWGSLAEGCAKYLHKGRGVRVVGRLKQDRWQSEDSKIHDRYVVVAEHVEFHPEPNRERTVDDGEPVEMECAPETTMDVFEQTPRSQKSKKS